MKKGGNFNNTFPHCFCSQLSLVYSVHQSLSVNKCDDKSWDYTAQPVAGGVQKVPSSGAVVLTPHAAYEAVLAAAAAIAANGAAPLVMQSGVPRPPPRCVRVY